MVINSNKLRVKIFELIYKIQLKSSNNKNSVNSHSCLHFCAYSSCLACFFQFILSKYRYDIPGFSFALIFCIFSSSSLTTCFFLVTKTLAFCFCVLSLISQMQIRFFSLRCDHSRQDNSPKLSRNYSQTPLTSKYSSFLAYLLIFMSLA